MPMLHQPSEHSLDISLDHIEATQDEVLARLDELNVRIELLLSEALRLNMPGMDDQRLHSQARAAS